MQYYFGFGVAFNIYCDRLSGQNNDLGDALVRKAMVNDFRAGMASNPGYYDFHGKMAPGICLPLPLSPDLGLWRLVVIMGDVGPSK